MQFAGSDATIGYKGTYFGGSSPALLGESLRSASIRSPRASLPLSIFADDRDGPRRWALSMVGVFRDQVGCIEGTQAGTGARSEKAPCPLRVGGWFPRLH